MTDHKCFTCKSVVTYTQYAIHSHFIVLQMIGHLKLIPKFTRQLFFILSFFISLWLLFFSPILTHRTFRKLSSRRRFWATFNEVKLTALWEINESCLISVQLLPAIFYLWRRCFYKAKLTESNVLGFITSSMSEQCVWTERKCIKGNLLICFVSCQQVVHGFPRVTPIVFIQRHRFVEWGSKEWQTLNPTRSRDNGTSWLGRVVSQ